MDWMQAPRYSAEIWLFLARSCLIIGQYALDFIQFYAYHQHTSRIKVSKCWHQAQRCQFFEFRKDVCHVVSTHHLLILWRAFIRIKPQLFDPFTKFGVQFVEKINCIVFLQMDFQLSQIREKIVMTRHLRMQFLTIIQSKIQWLDDKHVHWTNKKVTYVCFECNRSVRFDVQTAYLIDSRQKSTDVQRVFGTVIDELQIGCVILNVGYRLSHILFI